MTISVVAATENEKWLEVSNVYLTTWKTAYHDQISADHLIRLTPETWQPKERWQNTFLAKTTEGKIVGVCAFGSPRQNNNQGWGEIYSLYILPKYQGRGVGRRLFKTTLEKMEQDYVKLYLWVLSTNLSAQKFYQKFGFQLTSIMRTEKIPGGQLIEIQMTKTKKD